MYPAEARLPAGTAIDKEVTEYWLEGALAAVPEEAANTSRGSVEVNGTASDPDLVVIAKVTHEDGTDHHLVWTRPLCTNVVAIYDRDDQLMDNLKLHMPRHGGPTTVQGGVVLKRMAANPDWRPRVISVGANHSHIFTVTHDGSTLKAHQWTTDTSEVVRSIGGEVRNVSATADQYGGITVSSRNKHLSVSKAGVVRYNCAMPTPDCQLYVSLGRLIKTVLKSKPRSFIDSFRESTELTANVTRRIG